VTGSCGLTGKSESFAHLLHLVLPIGIHSVGLRHGDAIHGQEEADAQEQVDVTWTIEAEGCDGPDGDADDTGCHCETCFMHD
jgi:hypothetical protein